MSRYGGTIGQRIHWARLALGAPITAPTKGERSPILCVMAQAGQPTITMPMRKTGVATLKTRIIPISQAKSCVG